MPYVLFRDYFPNIAERETRTITVLDGSELNLPPAQYSLLEMYCDDPGCDCRRVFFYVVSSLKKDVEAIIAYGWESPQFYAEWMGDDDPKIIRELKGPALNFGSPQSDLAPAILRMIEDVVLRDPTYVQRIKTHYWMFRHQIDTKGKRTESKGKSRT